MAQKHYREFQPTDYGARTLQTDDRQTDRRIYGDFSLAKNYVFTLYRQYSNSKIQFELFFKLEDSAQPCLPVLQILFIGVRTVWVAGWLQYLRSRVSVHRNVTTLGKIFTHVCLCHRTILHRAVYKNVRAILYFTAIKSSYSQLIFENNFCTDIIMNVNNRSIGIATNSIGDSFTLIFQQYSIPTLLSLGALVKFVNNNITVTERVKTRSVVMHLKQIRQSFH